MTFFQRVGASLKSQGPRATLIKFYAMAADNWYDLRHGTDTGAHSTGLTIGSDNKDRSFGYQPTRVLPLRKLFKLLQPLMPSDSVLVDLGCGKGRVLLVAAESGFKEARGIEFAHELCEIAKKNCAILKTRTGIDPHCRVIESDVTQYEIQPDENVFFMFNPFDEVILEKVLANIATSLQSRRRKIMIIYYNPKCAQVIEQRKDFVRLREFNFWGYRFTVYANQE